MTNRQLFISAFGGTATHKVPVYEQAFASEVASKILGREAFTGAVMLHYQEAVWAMRGPEAYQEFSERVVEDVVELHRTLGFGALSCPWLGGVPTKQVSEYEFLYGDPEGWWEIRRYDPRAMTYGVVTYSQRPEWRGEEPIRAAVKGLETAVESFKTSGAAEGIEAYYRKWLDLAGDEFEVPGGAMLSVPMNEEWLTACAMVPELIAAYLDAQVEHGRLQMEVQANLGVRISWGGGDLADKNGPIYGPRFFREIVMPRYRKLAEHAHKVGMKYLFRSDGYLVPIYDDLFDGSGLDGFGEIDYDAGVRIPDLLARYPDLTCWGNVSCALLRKGTPQQIRAATEEIVAAGKPRGRLILGSSNTVLPGTPPENYFAMWEVVQ